MDNKMSKQNKTELSTSTSSISTNDASFDKIYPQIKKTPKNLYIMINNNKLHSPTTSGI